MNNQGSFTRGSQIYAHKFRMLGQGLNHSFLIGLGCSICWFFLRLVQKLDVITIYYYLLERYARLKLFIGDSFYPVHRIGIQFYHVKQGKFVYRPAMEFIDKFWFATPYGQNIKKFSQWFATYAGFEVFAAFMIGTVCTMLFFSKIGKEVIGSKKIRGGDLVSVSKLAGLLRRKKEASPIVLSGLPLVKDSETQHILLTGTTGSGKTNMLNELLPQIRLQQDRAIIFDLTGSFVNRFFHAETDILLNPFEKNTKNWLPWNDCHEDYDFDALASSFIDGEGFSDKYWEEAAQKVLSVALQKHNKTKDLKSLFNLICSASMKDFCEYFEGTSAGGLVSKEAEKGTASVRATLINKIEKLKYLKEGGDFSIKNWMNGGSGWLFITALPNQRDTLRPLVSAWIDIAIKGLMERLPEANNNKIWFILDELPALQKIPSLKRGLAEGRKYGGCFVAGIQNIFQIEEIYGHSSGLSLLDMFNSRFFFKVGDNRTAEYASKSLGEKQMAETKESLSYGADSMRDGVNINTQKHIEPLVMATEILNLPTRTCFVRLCGEYPITKLSMNLQK